MDKKSFNSLVDSIRKRNEDASTLDNDSIAKVEKWIPTGYYGLNAIISGDLFGGIPCGRVTTLFGPSQSGKSLLSALLQRNAQKMDMGVVIFDSEFDKDGRMEKSFGVDTSNVITIPVDTIEQTILEMTKVFSDIKEKNLQGQILLILDSIGGLSTDKEIEGAENNKLSQDMGLRAKWIRSLMRTMKAKCALTRCPFVVINHEIENPNAMYESIFKQQGGGHAIEFFSSVMINVGKKKEKQDAQNEFDETSALTKAGVTGQFIKCFTHKNRCAIPHKEVLCYLNYINGIDPYSGLKELIDMIPTVIYTKSAQGEIGKGYTYYLKNGEEEIKLGKYSEWRNDVAIWEKILPSLNEFVKSEFSYKLHI